MLGGKLYKNYLSECLVVSCITTTSQNAWCVKVVQKLPLRMLGGKSYDCLSP